MIPANSNSPYLARPVAIRSPFLKTVAAPPLVLQPPPLISFSSYVTNPVLYAGGFVGVPYLPYMISPAIIPPPDRNLYEHNVNVSPSVILAAVPIPTPRQEPLQAIVLKVKPESKIICAKKVCRKLITKKWYTNPTGAGKVCGSCYNHFQHFTMAA